MSGNLPWFAKEYSHSSAEFLFCLESCRFLLVLLTPPPPFKTMPVIVYLILPSLFPVIVYICDDFSLSQLSSTSSQFNISINFSKPAPLFYRKDVDGSTYLSESIYQLFPANFSLSSLSLTKRVSIKLTISSWSLPNLFDSAFKPNPPKLFFSLSSKELISAGFSWINFGIFCSFGWYPFRGTAKTGALECARSLHSNKDWSMQIPLK